MACVQDDSLAGFADRPAARNLLDDVTTFLAAPGEPHRETTRRRFGPPLTRIQLVAVGALAVTVAAAIVVTETGGSPSAPSPLAQQGHQQTQQLSARQVLLAAAVTAESRPATTGAYWQFSMLHEITGRGARHSQVISYWYGKDGSYWSGGRQLTDDTKNPTWLSKGKAKWKGYELVDQIYSSAEIQGLPTDPNRLLKWAYAQGTKHLGPGWRQQDVDSGVLTLLTEVLVEVPASPKVRAAAFRVLAGRPGVRAGGTAKDSQGRTGTVLLFGGERYIIDTKTTLLLSQQNVGPGAKLKQSTFTYLEVGWTNKKPAAPAVP